MRSSQTTEAQQKARHLLSYRHVVWLRLLTRAARAVVAMWLLAWFIPQTVSAQDITAADAKHNVAVIDEVWQLVETEFYDPQLRGLDAADIHSGFQGRARKTSVRHLPGLVNQMLSKLKTSHTAYYSKNNPRHYQLLGIFEFLIPDVDDPRLFYEGIGVETKTADGKHFASCVYDGSSAQKAGLKYGDEIISVDGQPWDGLRCFQGQVDQAVIVQIRRHKDAAPIDLSVNVERLNGRTVFDSAMRASVKKFASDDKTVGYIHLWSYAGKHFHEFVKQQLLWGELKDCSAVIIDLRDGWGGASLEYLNLFRPPLVRTSSRSRDGEEQSYDGAWTRPVVLLVNAGSTSGKEMYTYAFKKHKMGEVVGSRTAGAVMAGSPRMLPSGGVLYLAVRDVRIDGHRIEGVGVQPTVPVERPLMYAAGADPQLDAARETALKLSLGEK